LNYFNQSNQAAGLNFSPAADFCADCFRLKFELTLAGQTCRCQLCRDDFD
jgi:hypothetical protein